MGRHKGYRFVVWAPNAKEIHVVGDFNQWKGNVHPLKRITNEGLWVGFFTDIPENIPYKYEIIFRKWSGAIESRSICSSI